MNPNSENIFQRERVYLNKHTTNVSSIISHFYSKDIISHEEEEKLKNPYIYTTTFDLCDALYDLLTRKNIDENDLKIIFLESSNEHIVKHLWEDNFKHEFCKTWNLPPKNDIFTGRKVFLDDIASRFSLELGAKERTQLLSNSTCKIVLHGMGGTGKSSLALQFVYEYKKHFKNIFWLNSEEIVELKHQWIEIGLNLSLFSKEQMSHSAVNFEEMSKYLKRVWFEVEKNFNWLIVLDNALNYEDVENLFPNFGGCILVTSRHLKCWTKISNLIKISNFEVVDSEDFICKILGNSVEKSEASSLAIEMEHLPLALYHSCFYIKKYTIPILDYINYFTSYELEFIQEISEGESKSILKSCKISLDKILEESEISYEWLQICGNLVPENIPKLFILEFLNIKGQSPQVLKFLKIHENILRFGLFQWDINKETYSIHRIVQKVLRATNRNLEKTDGMTFEVLENSIEKRKNLRKFHIFNHAHEFLCNKMVNISKVNFLSDKEQLIHEMNGKIVNLMDKLRNFFKEMDGFDNKLYQYIEYIERSMAKKSETVLMDLYSNYTLCCYALGKFEKSQQFLKKSMAIVGIENVELDEIFKISEIVEKGVPDFKQAQIYSNKLLEIEKKSAESSGLSNFELNKSQMQNDPESQTTIQNILENFANANLKVDDLNMSNLETIARQIQILHDKILQPKSFKKDEEKEMQVLAVIEEFRRRCQNTINQQIKEFADDGKDNLVKFQKNLENQLKSMEFEEKNTKPNFISLASTYVNVSASYCDLDEFDLALEYCSKALKIMEVNYGQDYFQSSSIYTRYGMIYEKLNENEKALEYFKKALQVEEDHYGVDHEHSARIIHFIGTILIKLKEFDDSLEYLERAEKLITEKHGSNGFDIVDTLISLGKLHFEIDNFHKTLNYFEKVLEIQKNLFGEAHSTLADTLFHLGLVYGKLNQAERQLEVYQKCLEIKEEHFGENDEKCLFTVLIIGGIHLKNADFEQAIEMHEKVLKTEFNDYDYKMYNGIACFNLGVIYGIRGELEKALKYQLDALEYFKEIHGEDALQNNFILVEIGIIYEKMGEKFKALEVYEDAYQIYKNEDNCEKEIHHCFHFCEGKILENKGDLENAEISFKKCFDIRSKDFGEESIFLINILLALAQLNFTNGREDCGVEFIKKIEKIQEKFSLPTFCSEYIENMKKNQIQGKSQILPLENVQSTCNTRKSCCTIL